MYKRQKLVFAIRDGLNHKKGDPNYDIKQLALECASKRMYPDILNLSLIHIWTAGPPYSLSAARQAMDRDEPDGKVNGE